MPTVPTCATTGSSPLARGLRHDGRRQGGGDGIIPARAGFTARGGGRRRPRQDHPRSRGVYDADFKTAGDILGSSPLARGLRVDLHDKGWGPGIIPARAGFTQGLDLLVVKASDHPRSRGVYRACPASMSWGEGSSPLARGLRQRLPGAGPGRRDHPRSRGVYTRAICWLARTLGSSPLARGLHEGDLLAGADLGIIPARAGFTRLRTLSTGSARDHPRSRGVYFTAVPSQPGRCGSSPLARGLRYYKRTGAQERRIIPARAGFTLAWDSQALNLWDHPRSRGVYRPGTTPPTGDSGSSPLARGLHREDALTAGRARIIPARAGFTGPRSPPYGTGSDHPRSRGVYASSAAICSRARWIIPARAGFTSIRVINGPREGDHPRSRGVYQWRPRAMAVWRGSSPLARGLHRGPVVGDDGDRIIPARAGFTRSWTCPTPAGADHPRSRGVYDLLAPAVSFLAGSSPLARGLPVASPCDGGLERIIPARAGFTPWSRRRRRW